MIIQATVGTTVEMTLMISMMEIKPKKKKMIIKTTLVLKVMEISLMTLMEETKLRKMSKTILIPVRVTETSLTITEIIMMIAETTLMILMMEIKPKKKKITTQTLELETETN